MLKKILVGLAALIVVLVIAIVTRPADFRVTRSAVIPAPASAVFSQVNDLKNWEAWSPWAKIDPKMTQSYSGPRAGKGAVSMWSGNAEVGEGKMTITESRSNELVRFRLDFVKPFESTCDSEFTFKPEGNNTAVTWTMNGKNNFIGKAISLFMDCDKMVGGQFEKGLADLKTLVEAAKKQPVAATP
jgi:hypothetical protein